jgi:hypothetical protein
VVIARGTGDDSYSGQVGGCGVAAAEGPGVSGPPGFAVAGAGASDGVVLPGPVVASVIGFATGGLTTMPRSASTAIFSSEGVEDDGESSPRVVGEFIPLAAGGVAADRSTDPGTLGVGATDDASAVGATEAVGAGRESGVDTAVGAGGTGALVTEGATGAAAGAAGTTTTTGAGAGAGVDGGRGAA